MKDIFDLHDAIYKLYKNVTCIDGENVAYDAEGNKVTYDKAAVDAYLAANEYKALRQAEYPSIVDQLDTIFHDGLEAWKEQIQEVKDKYPKA
jgi:hypothetical protein